MLVAIACNAPLFNGIPGDMLEFVRHHSLGLNWATAVVAAMLFWLASKVRALFQADAAPVGRLRSVLLIAGLLLAGLALQFQVQRLRTAAWLHWEADWKVGPLPATGLEASGFRIINTYTGGYLNDAYAVHDVGWLLANYDEATRSFHIHPHNKPPGSVLLLRVVITAVEALPDSILRIGDRALEAFPGLNVAVAVLEDETVFTHPPDSALPADEVISRRLAYPIVVMLVNLLLVSASTLAAIPIFYLARELLGDAVQALWVAVAWLCHPGLLVMGPTFDQLYPLLSSVLLLAAVWSRRVPYRLGPLLVGLLLALGLWFTPLFTILIPVCAVLAVWPRNEDYTITTARLIPRCVLAMLAIVATAAVPLLLLKLFTGFDYVANFLAVSGTAGKGINLSNLAAQWHGLFNRTTRFHKPYIGAIFFNQYELALSCGLAAFTLGVVQTFGALKRVSCGLIAFALAVLQTIGAFKRVFAPWSEVFTRWARINRLDLFLLGTVGALLFLTVSGLMDYEACRLGLPLMPAVLIAAIGYLDKAFPNAKGRHVMLMTLGVLQLLWVMVIREFMILT